jgi:hypothetical protein
MTKISLFEEEEEYGTAVKENVGIELGEVENNSGKRAVAKICLNSYGANLVRNKIWAQQNMLQMLRDFMKFY